MTHHINLPYELFNVQQGITAKIAQVTSWFRPVTYETPQFRVKLNQDQWADLLSKDDMGSFFSFYVRRDSQVKQHRPSDGGEYGQWIQIANVLFYVES
jgi:hypothetical protein